MARVRMATDIRSFLGLRLGADPALPAIARTTPAHPPNSAHCAPVLRTGALLACPDAQRALLHSVLPHPGPDAILLDVMM